jgi:hypothetical protein
MRGIARRGSPTCHVPACLCLRPSVCLSAGRLGGHGESVLIPADGAAGCSKRWSAAGDVQLTTLLLATNLAMAAGDWPDRRTCSQFAWMMAADGQTTKRTDRWMDGVALSTVIVPHKESKQVSQEPGSHRRVAATPTRTGGRGAVRRSPWRCAACACRRGASRSRCQSSGCRRWLREAASLPPAAGQAARPGPSRLASSRVASSRRRPCLTCCSAC